MGDLTGLEKGYYQITNDLNTELMRVGGNQSVPGNNFFWDAILLFIAWVSHGPSSPNPDEWLKEHGTLNPKTTDRCPHMANDDGRDHHGPYGAA